MHRNRNKFNRGNTKRDFPKKVIATDSDSNFSNSETLKSFQSYAAELDDKNDRYERIYKISRDITIESKRLIFSLHTFQRGAPDAENVLSKAKIRLTNLIRSEFFSIMKELHELDMHQYLRAYSFGVQEFIEAFSFYHYLENDTLITYQEIQDFFIATMDSELSMKTMSTNEFSEKEEFEESEKNTPKTKENENDKKQKERSNYEQKSKTQTSYVTCNPKIVTLVDYVLGLNDLSGELMRFSINRISAGEVKRAFDICKFLNHLYVGMLSVGFVSRDYNRKMVTFKQSIRKVELACYTVCVRGSEIPKHMIASVLENDYENDEDLNF